jgi:transcriptional regulator with XRE-family HTH domain
MALTEFGKSVRKARIEVDESLRSMAKEIGISSSFLSGLETGTKNITPVWLDKIKTYFKNRNHEINKLKELADISNKSVHLHDGLSQQQKMLIAGFANSPFNPEELKKFADVLKMMNDKQEHGK